MFDRWLLVANDMILPKKLTDIAYETSVECLCLWLGDFVRLLVRSTTCKDLSNKSTDNCCALLMSIFYKFDYCFTCYVCICCYEYRHQKNSGNNSCVLNLFTNNKNILCESEK